MQRSLAALFSIVVIDLVGFGIVVPVLPFLVDAFDVSAAALGLLVASYAAMQFVFAPIWGRLSDRIGRRPVMLMTIAGSSGALLMAGLSPSLLWLFAARILGGVFAANISVASAYISDATDESRASVYRMAANDLGSSGEPKLPWPSTRGWRYENGWAINTIAS